jgi:hypothetical protein
MLVEKLKEKTNFENLDKDGRIMILQLTYGVRPRARARMCVCVRGLN